MKNRDSNETGREDRRTEHRGKRTGGIVKFVQKGDGNACLISASLSGPEFDRCTRELVFQGEHEMLDVAIAILRRRKGGEAVPHSIHTGDQTGGRLEIIRKENGPTCSITVCLRAPHFDGCTRTLQFRSEDQMQDFADAIFAHFRWDHD